MFRHFLGVNIGIIFKANSSRELTYNLF